MTPRIVAFGEGMIEISGTIGVGRLGTGGDMLNVAVALARLGHMPAFLTALGRDPWSDVLAQAWVAEGIDPSLVVRHPNRIAGLYGVRTDSEGERSFTYWRETSAARDFFALPEAEALLARAGGAELLILSGITLSLFDDAGRRRIAALAAAVRAHGGAVAFDGNYRPGGWPDPAAARAAFAAFEPYVSIALPTADDETALYGPSTPKAIAQRWHDAGATEVAVKLGRDGALVSVRDAPARHVAAERLTPIDTTGAGDAFDAGYLSARLGGALPADAAAFANRVAAVTILHPGAIPPRHVITALAAA